MLPHIHVKTDVTMSAPLQRYPQCVAGLFLHISLQVCDETAGMQALAEARAVVKKELEDAMQRKLNSGDPKVTSTTQQQRDEMVEKAHKEHCYDKVGVLSVARGLLDPLQGVDLTCSAESASPHIHLSKGPCPAAQGRLHV